VKIVKSFCCTEMKNKTVKEASGKTIGHIGDLTFTFAGALKISHFMLAGPAWDRFLKAIHLKSDTERIFDSSIIEKIDDHIHLNLTGDQLAKVLNEGTISDDEIRFSDLKKMDISDMDQTKVGRAIDVDIDTEGCISIIAGGGFIEEKMESIGLKEDIDIIVPCSVINSIGSSIQLTVKKGELDTTLDGVLKEKMIEIKKARKEASRQHRDRRDRVYPFFPLTTK